MLTKHEYLSLLFYGHGPGVRDFGPRDRMRPLDDDPHKKRNATALDPEDAVDVYYMSSLAVSMTEAGKKGMEEAVTKATEAKTAAEKALTASRLAHTTAFALADKLRVLKSTTGRQQKADALKKDAQKIFESIENTLNLSALAIANCTDARSKTAEAVAATDGGIEQVKLMLLNLTELKRIFIAAKKNTSIAEESAKHAITRSSEVRRAALRAGGNADEAKAKLAEAVKIVRNANTEIKKAKGYTNTRPPGHLLGDATTKGWKHMVSAAQEALAAVKKAESAFNDAEESLREAERTKKDIEELEEVIKAVQEAAEAELKKNSLTPEGLAESQTQGESLQQSQQEESAQQSGSQDSTVSTVDPTSGEVSHPSSPAVLAPAVPAPSPAAPGAAGADAGGSGAGGGAPGSPPSAGQIETD
ncbi:hypothetical protein DQ04_15121020, partial [Trypanosoma grayi]|uniref:hypothetical protein n=1 Tax=Trypanosoma grayi TaxID=71804 RepID=UPI0004F44816